MEQVELNYSRKNIPLPNNRDFQQIFLEKTRTFLRNVTLLVMVFLNPNFKSKNIETFGFKSSFEPKRIPELRDFEDQMLDMAVNLEFKDKAKSTDKFQSHFYKDIKEIRRDKNLYINNKYIQSKSGET